MEAEDLQERKQHRKEEQFGVLGMAYFQNSSRQTYQPLTPKFSFLSSETQPIFLTSSGLRAGLAHSRVQVSWLPQVAERSGQEIPRSIFFSPPLFLMPIFTHPVFSGTPFWGLPQVPKCLEPALPLGTLAQWQWACFAYTRFQVQFPASSDITRKAPVQNCRELL